MSDPDTATPHAQVAAGSATVSAPGPASAPVRSFSQNARSIAIQTALGQDVLLLRSFGGDEGISRLFRFDLELLSEQPSIDVSGIIGKPSTIGVRLADNSDRFFNGIISRIALIGSESRFTVYRAELVPWTWLLTRTSDCRIFQSLAVPAIVEKVFGDLGFQNFSNRLQKTYTPREYTVQYRETDFNFVSRLMEEAGIFYFFEHENGKHTLVMADTSSEHHVVPGLEKIRFRSLSPTDYEPDVISSWAVAHEIRPSKYTLAAYNFETPATNLTVSVESAHAAAGATPLEVYDFPGGYQGRSEGEGVVGLRIEEQETHLVTIRGAGTCRALRSGTRFDLNEHPTNALNQGYVVTSVSHSASEPSYIAKDDPAAGRYRNVFTAIPLAVPFRPPRTTPRPVIHGVQTAVVVGKKGEELWVDKYGRVKVQFFWDREGKRDENSSCWIRVSQQWAGKRWGAIVLPRVGQEVIVEFLEGDPDCPIITGRVYNAGQTPPYDLPADQTKTAFKSSTSKGGGGFNELRFEDKKDEEQIFIHGQRDLDFVIERESREWIGGERHLIVQKSRFEHVGNEQHLKVVADSIEEVGGTRHLKAAKGLVVKADGRVFIDAAGDITLRGPGGFITLGADGITIEGKVVNINSGGSVAAVAPRAATAPHKASSAGFTGGTDAEPTAPQMTMEEAELARVELYRKTGEDNADKMSAEDRKAYQAALLELQQATANHDQAGMQAAKAKLDAILQKNNIPIPADPTLNPAVLKGGAGSPTTGSGTDADPSAIPLRTLARIRGAMWTVPGPWQYGPRPGQPNNITALEYIYAYPPDVQQKMIDTYKSYGYTHCCIGPINAQSYHGAYPDQNFEGANFDKFLNVLQMLWNNGLMPIVFMHPDNGTYNQTVAMYDPVIRGNPRAQKLIRIVVPTGWEPTRYGWSSNTWANYCKWAHDLLPNALILIHTVADVDAPVGTDENGNDNGRPNGEGWARVVPHIHGWLVQSNAFANPDEKGGDTRFPNNTNFENFQNLFRISDAKSYKNRFHNGYAGWPTNSLWGNEPIKIIAAEYCSYWVYWKGRTYEEGVKWGNAAIAAGADGYLDSGSVDVP